MLGNMSTQQGGQSKVEGTGQGGSTAGPGPPKFPASEGGSRPEGYPSGAPPNGHSKDLDQTDSLNNNSPMERNTNPDLKLNPHGIPHPHSSTHMESLIDKNANYGSSLQNNKNSGLDGVPLSGLDSLPHAESDHPHTEHGSHKHSLHMDTSPTSTAATGRHSAGMEGRLIFIENNIIYFYKVFFQLFSLFSSIFLY